MIEDLDWSVGRVFDKLKELNLTDNTLVFITSDNGGDVNGSVGALRGRKQLTYEGGQRVPMIVSYPNLIDRPRVTSAMATNMDLFPTILELLNIDPPSDRTLDGKSILELLSGSEGSPHPYVFYNAAGSGKFEGVRDREFKYHEKAIGTSMSVLGMLSMTPQMPPQLTDINRDNESHNLIKKYPDRASLLKSILDAKRSQVEKNMRGWAEE